MAIPQGGNNTFLSCLRLLIRRRQQQQQQQRFCHVLNAQRQGYEAGMPPQLYPEISSDFVACQLGYMDMKKWKKVDSRSFGIDPKVIPPASWTVLRVLRNQGFAAYLVGGCVRDLLLNRMPKDFDVITTANLQQIKKQFHRSIIVGQRFPICRVHLRGSVTEVSSFETVAKHAEEKEELNFSQAPRGCGKKDFVLWRNSVNRDFTINSLFYDPFSNKIYDYANGMSDLRSLKLQTLIPAEVSFREDCARILRGLRFAARLGLSFSKDTEAAIYNLSSSIMDLAKSRIMMELNYMLSYGAAEPSLCLLQRFNLLKIILPFHAAYLEQRRTKSDQNPVMFLKLFFNLDKVVSCNHPSDCRLWVGLLAFHLALVNNPQDALVVLAFASILYHGEWKEGIRFARENAEVTVDFVPELSRSFESKSNEKLAEEISQLATFVQDSIDVLIDQESLLESMSRYPISPCSGLVFISKKVGRDVGELFKVLEKQMSSCEKRRESFGIDYNLLGKGFLWETRFVLGKVILETMGCATLPREGWNVGEGNNYMHKEINDETCNVELSDLVKEQLLVKKDGEHSISLNSSEVKQKSTKKRKLVVSKCSLPKQEMTLEKQEVIERGMCEERAKKHQTVDETDELQPTQELISVLKNMWEKRCQLPDEDVIEKKKGDVENRKSKRKNQKSFLVVEKKHRILEDKVAEQQEVVGIKAEAECKQVVGKEKPRSRQLLSSLFK